MAGSKTGSKIILEERKEGRKGRLRTKCGGGKKETERSAFHVERNKCFTSVSLFSRIFRSSSFNLTVNWLQSHPMQACVARTPARAHAVARTIAGPLSHKTYASPTVFVFSSRTYASTAPGLPSTSSHIPPPILSKSSEVPRSNSTSASSSLTPKGPHNTEASGPRLQHAHLLTAVHNARELLPRILDPESEELQFWSSALRDTADELAGVGTGKENRLKVVGAFWCFALRHNSMKYVNTNWRWNGYT